MSFCDKCGRGSIRDDLGINPEQWSGHKVGFKNYEYEVVAIQTVPPTNGYGEYDQGSTFELFLVVKDLKTGEFFKFTGTADSYGEEVWNTTAFEVKATQKLVTVYEFE